MANLRMFAAVEPFVVKPFKALGERVFPENNIARACQEAGSRVSNDQLTLSKFAKPRQVTRPDGTVLVWDKDIHTNFQGIDDAVEKMPNIIRFDKPIPVQAALKKLSVLKGDYPDSLVTQQELIDFYLQAVKESPELADVKVMGTIGKGSNSLVLQTTENQVLKLSLNPQFMRDFNPDFDLPVLRKGQITALGDLDDKLHTMHYYFQPMVDLKNVLPEHADMIREKITQAGYTTHDFVENATCQIGLYQGRPYLLDPECARQLPFTPIKLDYYPAIASPEEVLQTFQEAGGAHHLFQLRRGKPLDSDGLEVAALVAEQYELPLDKTLELLQEAIKS